MSIEWKKGAVCFDGNEQWFVSIEEGQLISACGSYGAYYEDLVSSDNFQLNEIRQGDCIVVDSLTTVTDYEKVLDVFELFGFTSYENNSFEDTLFYKWFVVDKDGDLIGDDFLTTDYRRIITLEQLMAIGELQRMMNERDEQLIDAVENTNIMSDILNNHKTEYTLGQEVILLGNNQETKGKITALPDKVGKYLVTTETGFHMLVDSSEIKEYISEQDNLVAKLNNLLNSNNAPDNYILAMDIINGNIKGLTFDGDV